MHEQLMREFAERAEATIELPDLARIEGRARERRRTQLTTLTVTAVAVLAVVAFLAFRPGADRTVPAPKPDSPDLVVQSPVPDKELAAGREYTVEAYGQDYVRTIPEGERLVATFTVVGDEWIWLKDAVGKFGPGSDLENGPFTYAAVQFSLIDRVATTQCTPTATVWQDAASTPLGIAQQITRVPGVEVVEKPATGQRYGYPAAHVQLVVSRVCRDSQVAVLWSIFPSSTAANPGVGTVFLPGQRVDLWILGVEGSMVAVNVDHTPGLPRPLIEELHAIADSLKFDLVVD
jgi:hypothetical protein